MSNKVIKLKSETSRIVGSAGIDLLDLPDIICWDDWVDKGMNDKEIKETAQDVAWEILDNAGLDMDTNNQICYGE